MSAMARLMEQSDNELYKQAFADGFAAGHSEGGSDMMNYIMGWGDKSAPDAEKAIQRHISMWRPDVEGATTCPTS